MKTAFLLTSLFALNAFAGNSNGDSTNLQCLAPMQGAALRLAAKHELTVRDASSLSVKEALGFKSSRKSESIEFAVEGYPNYQILAWATPRNENCDDVDATLFLVDAKGAIGNVGFKKESKHLIARYNLETLYGDFQLSERKADFSRAVKKAFNTVDDARKAAVMTKIDSHCPARIQVTAPSNYLVFHDKDISVFDMKADGILTEVSHRPGKSSPETRVGIGQFEIFEMGGPSFLSLKTRFTENEITIEYRHFVDAIGENYFDGDDSDSSKFECRYSRSR